MTTIKPFLGAFAIVCGLAVDGHSQSFLRNGLVAYYPFNGNADDESGNGNQGTVSGATISTDRFGIPNGAYYFAGDGSDISISDSPSLDITNALTLSAWIKIEAGGVAQPRILEKHVFDLGLSDTSGTPQLFLNIQNYPSGGASIITAPLHSGQWIFVAGTYDRQTLRLYTNGILAAQTIATVPIDVNSLPIGIGQNLESGADWFKGYIDDVRIYNRALSSTEVAQLNAIESAPLLPYLNLAINLTIFQQNTSNDNGVVTTTASPKPLAYATKDILNVLAFDENLEGNWPSNSFPKSAKLAIAGNSIIVVNGTNVLLSVSDIMSINVGETEIISGAQNDATGLASHAAQKRRISKITFDDTFIVSGKNLKFFLQGLLTEATTDTTPIGSTYTEMRTAKITNAAGERSSQHVPFVCTGTLTATGRSALSR